MNPVERIDAIRTRVDAAARSAGRDPAEVRLLAVSKTFAAERVLEIANAGLEAFGENRIQEASRKIPEVAANCERNLEWHLIGQLQRNKARKAVELFDVIHTVDRPELVDELAKAARALSRRPRILLQLNIDREPQKGGADPSALPDLVRRVGEHPELRLEGLMAIPRVCEDPEEVRPSFARLRELRDAINAGRAPAEQLRELSMGMSSDFEVAIAEGATWVRLGTALFGPRDSK